MISVNILLYLQILSITGGHIIIYSTGDDSQHQTIKWDGEDLGRQIADFKDELVSINKQIGVLKTRIDDLEVSKEGTESVLPSTTQEPADCPSGWHHYNDSCFFFDFVAVNFSTAESVCRKHNAHLIHLETKEENEYLKKLLPEIYRNIRERRYLVWIGITDATKEGVWTMTGSDKIVPFFDWGNGEPQNESNDPTGQDCAVFFSDANFKWADINCSSRTAYIACEKSKRN